MDNRTAILALVGALILGGLHALDKNTPAFAELADKWRALLAGGLGIASAIVDSMVNGTALMPAFVTAFAVSGPSFVVLIVSALANNIAGKPGGSGSIDLSKDAKSLPPLNPPHPAGPYSVKLAEMPAVLVGLSCLAVSFALVCALVCSGCAASNKACSAIKIANETCDAFLVDLPDGTQEKVPAAEIRKFAVQRKTMRLEAEKVEKQTP